MKNRIDKLSEIMKDKELDSFFAASETNVRYLTGFTGDSSTCFIKNGECALITDYRYAEQALSQCHGVKVEVRDRQAETIGQTLARLAGPGKKRMGFESLHTSHALYMDIRGNLAADSLTPTEEVIERMRLIKEPAEIACLRKAGIIAARALKRLLPKIKPGIREKELAFTLEMELRDLGSEGLAFPIISVFGERAALPHGQPSERALKPGEFITLDFGAVVEGYRSDMTRTFLTGPGDEKHRRVYSLVKDAQAAAQQAARAGIGAADLDAKARDILEKGGFAEYAGDGLGHGVGLDIHELPFMKPTCPDLLVENAVVTIEPGLYLPGWGGVRIEDTILIGKDSAETLTPFNKELVLI